MSQLLGVWQTYLTATIGNGVTASLRVRLFTRLEQMELGFFTRTRTGVIQSRLANDVGGVANVLSNTVSSVVGNTVTVIAAFVAMFLLSWQLALIAIVLLPLLAVVQRSVGQRRARIATQTQESLSELSAITQEALSVSGILLAKAFTRQRQETERYTAESTKQLRLQVRQEMSGQGFFVVVQIFLLIVPAIVYLVVRRPARQRRRHHGGHDRGLHHGPGAADLAADGAAARRARPADLLRPVRADLRVPRPRARHHGRAGRGAGAVGRRARPGRVRPRRLRLPRRPRAGRRSRS